MGQGTRPPLREPIERTAAGGAMDLEIGFLTVPAIEFRVHVTQIPEEKRKAGLLSRSMDETKTESL